MGNLCAEMIISNESEVRMDCPSRRNTTEAPPLQADMDASSGKATGAAAFGRGRSGWGVARRVGGVRRQPTRLVSSPKAKRNPRPQQQRRLVQRAAERRKETATRCGGKGLCDKAQRRRESYLRALRPLLEGNGEESTAEVRWCGHRHGATNNVGTRVAGRRESRLLPG